MAKNAASEGALGELHATVAKVLTNAIQSEEVNAAMLGAAITFLKNNNITANAEHNAELGELARALADKRKAGKERLSDFRMAEEAFDAHLQKMQ